MAFGSQGLNTPDQQAKAIAINKAEAFAKDCYVVAADVEALKEADGKADENVKKAQDFMSKLNDKTRPVFTEVYNASCVVLAAAPAEVEATEVAPAEATEVVAPVEATEVAAVETTEVAAPAEATEVVEVAKVAENAPAAPAEEVAPVTEPTMTVAEAEEVLAGYEGDKKETRTSPYWLIFTYLILTFAELLLSPMGISFVSKVAPPKLKGLMMGGWFVATAIGNMLVAVGGFLWAGLPLWSVWTVFIVLCLLSALFMFVMMKRLESVTK
jgi:hypothetical protein